MKGIYVNKKAFTLIEIILALIIASIASAYVIKTLLAQDFKEDLVSFQDNLQYIIEEGIASPMGYASSGGTPCSNNYNYAALDTENLFNCLQRGESWQDLTYLDDNGIDYITNTTNGFLNYYGGNDDGNVSDMGCGIRTAVSGTSDNQFLILVDCSRIAPKNINDRDEKDNRRLAYVEEAVEFLFARKLEYMFVRTDREVTRLNGTGTGTTNDGIIWGEFRH
jgi:prepilin-type N-terminal cleavage/methylation domain-containing protein